ncbi:MAG TPA: toll/interleukin-1 receptor domain-containing protein [Planctomycetaceae bacterium]|nr:toll/interleukin-1 receptor domain-containing protein [Planctomycetaceae bacterium]
MSEAGHVFISYSHVDHGYVTSLAERLTAAGVPVSYDHQLEPGQGWSAQLEAGIRDARLMLVVLTTASSESVYVRREIHFADDKVSRIVPLLRETCTLPLPLADKQWLEGRGARGLSGELISEVAALFRDPRAAIGRSPHELPRQPRRRVRSLLAGAAVVMLGLLIIAGWLSGRRPPLVVLMDSAIPRQVYDDRTRASGGTNADDINDLLKDLPIRLVKETTSLEWRREEQVRQLRPDLIVMHLSCFYSETNIEDSDRKFWSFIESMQGTGTRFIVYSRGLPERPDALTLRRWNDFLHGITSRDEPRITLIEVGREAPSFRSPATGRRLKGAVKAALNLR